ncbi:hypothetical protein B0O80DRAFT_526264 [Mortierella sp. GBAus27b]|nr:hypothetical protein B0O80DRAFT_526264 [Mortierella sp. GBAus27b]
MAMKSVFKENFNKLQGIPWSLPSGVLFDNHLCEAIAGLDQESTLHALVIEDLDGSTQLFETESDQDNVVGTKVPPQSKGLFEFCILTGPEILYMEASKKDSGVNSTKCLQDTKDAHDPIRERTVTNVRDFWIPYFGNFATVSQHV